ncbi:hypothetical protein D3C78_1208100 [compost metagenome]
MTHDRFFEGGVRIPLTTHVTQADIRVHVVQDRCHTDVDVVTPAVVPLAGGVANVVHAVLERVRADHGGREAQGLTDVRVQVDLVVVVELLVQFVRYPETNAQLRVKVDGLDRVDLAVTVGLLVVLDVVAHGGRSDDDHLCLQVPIQRHLLEGDKILGTTNDQELASTELERLFEVVLPAFDVATLEVDDSTPAQLVHAVLCNEGLAPACLQCDHLDDRVPLGVRIIQDVFNDAHLAFARIVHLANAEVHLREDIVSDYVVRNVDQVLGVTTDLE